MKKYLRFFAMILTSSCLMYLAMYLNTYTVDHVYWSEMRFYMTLLMGAVMTAVMLSFMLHMFNKKYVNMVIFSASALIFMLALYLVRSQTTVSQVSYMRAMIPHHSIAILTSERAQIVDPRVRKLADEIIQAQRKEIAEMKALIEELE
jgi:uncharacterized membrane protein